LIGLRCLYVFDMPFRGKLRRRRLLRGDANDSKGNRKYRFHKVTLRAFHQSFRERYLNPILPPHVGSGKLLAWANLKNKRSGAG
jgi:hypothetical protein